MSLKPGVGAGILEKVAEVITRYDLLTPEGDVPVTLRHGTQLYPLGRYLRRQLRKKLGLDQRSPNVLSPEASYQAFINNTEMQAVHEAARLDKVNPSFKYHLLQASKGKVDQVIARQKLYGKKAKGQL